MTDDQDLAERLCRLPEIRDVHVVHHPGGRRTVLLAQQGFAFGPLLRDAVLDEVPGEEELVDVVIVSRIPRSVRGAVDGAAAERLAGRVDLRYRYEAPRTDDERAVAALLLELLACRRVSMTDNLAALGADSIMIVELVNEVSRRFGATVDSVELFTSATVRDVVELIFTVAPSAWDGADR